MIALLACTASGPDTGWTPEQGWTNDEPPEPDTIFEGLADPRGLLVVDGSYVIAEMDAGRVVSIDGGGLEVLAEGLDEPYMLAATTEGLLVTERSGRVLHIGEETTTLAEGLNTPGRIVSEGGTAWWLDEGTGELWTAELATGEASVLATLDTPVGLSGTEDGVLVASAGGCDCVVRITEDGTQTVVVEVDENPVDVLATDEGVFLSTQYHNWPYGGWIYLIEDGTAEQLSYSPPKPSWLAANEANLYWMTSEVIVSTPFSGGTYEPVAILTAPGDLVANEDSVTWTDRQRGELLTVPVR